MDDDKGCEGTVHANVSHPKVTKTPTLKYREINNIKGNCCSRASSE